MSPIFRNLFFIIAVVAGILLSQYYAARFNNKRESLDGQKAPKFKAESVSAIGEKFKLSDVIGKKVLLINFWATWCAPCREEMPVLNALSKELDGEKFQIVSLIENDTTSIEELQAALNKFKIKIPVDFPVYRDKDGMIADAYGTYKIPESFIVDKMGYVAAHHVGGITESDKNRLIGQIRAFMKADIR